MRAVPRAVIVWPSKHQDLTGGQGFSRRQRLLKAAEFEAVFAHRCAVRTAYFQILAKPNEYGCARLGLVVSKRLFPLAVDRNNMRRQIRETFRHMATGLPASDLVVRPLSVIQNTAPLEGLRQDLMDALGKAAEKCCPAC
jgi:ribonuclease P protein component